MNLEGTPYRVEPMSLADVPTVSSIERTIFTLPWSPSAFKRELRHRDTSEYLVLRYVPKTRAAKGAHTTSGRVEGLLGIPTSVPSLLGYGGFWMVFEEAHICTLAVRPEWRGRGLGELLLASLIDRALVRKAEVMALEVRASNVAAQNLYFKYGFALVGRRRGYYSDNREDALLMKTGSIVSADYQQQYRQLTSLLCQRLSVELDLSPAGRERQTKS